MTQKDRDFQKVLQALTAFDKKLSTLEDVVRHPIVAELLERYQDDYELGALSAEETLSMWIQKQTYDEPQITNRYFYKIRN